MIDEEEDDEDEVEEEIIEEEVEEEEEELVEPDIEIQEPELEEEEEIQHVEDTSPGITVFVYGLKYTFCGASEAERHLGITLSFVLIWK